MGGVLGKTCCGKEVIPAERPTFVSLIPSRGKEEGGKTGLGMRRQGEELKLTCGLQKIIIYNGINTMSYGLTRHDSGCVIIRVREFIQCEKWKIEYKKSRPRLGYKHKELYHSAHLSEV
jgi:hypothetical protein